MTSVASLPPSSRRPPLLYLFHVLLSKSFSSAGESEQDQDNNVSLASLGEINDEEEEERSQEMMIESSALKLSVKEKRKLASYAHSLGDKLKCQLVGKSGVTDSVVFSFLETLKKNELVKVKIHKTMPWRARGRYSAFGGRHWFSSSRPNRADCDIVSS